MPGYFSMHFLLAAKHCKKPGFSQQYFAEFFPNLSPQHIKKMGIPGNFHLWEWLDTIIQAKREKPKLEASLIADNKC